MKILRTRRALKQWRETVKDVGFVPTMGALHEGHMSLVQRSQKAHRSTIVSIFVNPTQFGPHEDFQKYPRPLENDLALLRQRKVSAVFIPTVTEIYREGSETRVEPDPFLDSILEGPRRPGHFSGVATVVTKLFHLVQPTAAFFGEKDFQQIRVIENLCKHLCLSVRVRRVPTCREKSGLAMSSRNRYLEPASREEAANFYRILKVARTAEEARDRLNKSGFEVEYVEDWEVNLRRPRGPKDRLYRRLSAVRFQGVRLIDNVRLRQSVAS